MPDADGGLRAVVFDFDDTLTDYTTLEAEIWRQIEALICSSLHGVDRAELRRRYVNAERHYVRVLNGDLDMLGYRHARLGEAIEPWGVADEELFDAYRRHKERLLDEVELRPDALATMRSLRARGLRLGVLTNGESGMQRRKLDRLRIAGEVDAIAVSGEIGVAKPAPGAYLTMAELLDVAPRHAAMVGDSLEWDVRGPLLAGFAAGVYLRRHDQHPPAGVVSIVALSELAAALGLT